MYLFQKNLLVEAIMDNCFYLNQVYVFKKIILCGRKTQNPLYSLS